jgi:polyphosphate glucokinase
MLQERFLVQLAGGARYNRKIKARSGKGTLTVIDMSTRKAAPRIPKVLVIDIGGSHIKVLAPGSRNPIEINSGPRMTPGQMVAGVEKAVGKRPYDVVSLGYPGLVTEGVRRGNPPNLGKGWVRFDFARAFHRPVKIINDAAMQALGSYHGGRMLFLGLGTGLGSALVLDGVLHATELGNLPYLNDRPCSDYVNKAALQKMGKARWSRHVNKVVRFFAQALLPDYTVLGGGQAKLVENIPPGTEVVDNSKAFLGGKRLWQNPPRFGRLKCLNR